VIRVSVIVVSLNTCDLLRACLRSVFEAGGKVSFEVIVIDNGSVDGSADMVRREFPRVRLVVNERNEGFARPNNTGMRMAAGEFFFLVNSDAELRPGTTDALVDFLEATPQAGSCGPRLLYPDGRHQPSVKGFPTICTHAWDMLFLDRLFPQSRVFGKGEMAWFDYDRAARVDHVMAAALMVRRTTVDDVGMLDEDFAIYYNDMDWCYRMNRRGWETWYVPDATVVHHLGKTVGVVNRDFRYFETLHHNVTLFYQKHYGRLSVVVYRLLTAAGFSVRAVYWSVVSLWRSDEAARHMRRFAWLTLRWGLTFWRPAIATPELG
jgi:GT2 family glycosyltransferase